MVRKRTSKQAKNRANSKEVDISIKNNTENGKESASIDEQGGSIVETTPIFTRKRKSVADYIDATKRSRILLSSGSTETLNSTEKLGSERANTNRNNTQLINERNLGRENIKTDNNNSQVINESQSREDLEITEANQLIESLQIIEDISSSKTGENKKLEKNKQDKGNRKSKAVVKKKQRKKSVISRITARNISKEIKTDHNLIPKNNAISCTDCFFKDSITILCIKCKKDLYGKSSVDELIKIANPPLCQQVPVPNQSWRAKYPVFLRKCDPIEYIFISNTSIKTLFYSYFPSQSRTIFLCDVCLEDNFDGFAHERHLMKCKDKFGNLIYREKNGRSYLKVYEVDGENHKDYSRRLCMLGKFFLDHKTLYYDVEPFLFYTLFIDDTFVGFFSKEKVSSFNLSCIVVLPIYQGKGFGYFLVDLSYKLTISQNKTGTPEKPLSSQGLNVYRNYWIETVYEKILGCSNSIVLNDVAKSLGMTVDDVVYALEQMNFLVKGDLIRIEVLERKPKEMRKVDVRSFL